MLNCPNWKKKKINEPTGRKKKLGKENDKN